MADLPTDQVFAASSFWYAPIPVDAPRHPNSDAFKKDFLRQVATYYGPNVAVNTTSYASPVYTVDAGVQTQKVRSVPSYAALNTQWAAVPIPAHAVPAHGTDLEMTIYQPATNRIWEFWQAKKTDTGWTGRWGGGMVNVSTHNGIWTKPFGTTATGLPFLGGQVTSDELLRGEIRHAIGIALVECEASSVLSWPALRGDGVNTNLAANRIPQGLRFRIDPTVDVSALKMHAVAKTIARAGQKYGFVVWDKSGAVALRCQNPLDHTSAGLTNPYTAIFKGTPTYSLLARMPWDRIQFMPMHYGKPA